MNPLEPFPIAPFQIAAFGVFSALLVYLSRKPLRHPGSHGFTRFFAWEAILGLLVLHAPVWHRDMWGAQQLLSWALLGLSVTLAVLGVRGLKAVAHAPAARADAALYGFENTAQLVTTGIFGLIRHPMYAALLLLAWGAFTKDISAASLALVAVASLALWLTALRDERECLAFFGEGYRAYMQKTKRFVPWVW